MGITIHPCSIQSISQSSAVSMFSQCCSGKGPGLGRGLPNQQTHIFHSQASIGLLVYRWTIDGHVYISYATVWLRNVSPCGIHQNNNDIQASTV